MLAALKFAEIVGIITIGGVLIAALGVLLDQLHRRRSKPAAPGREQREALANETAADLARLKGLLDQAWVGVLQRGKSWPEDDSLVANYEAIRDSGRELIARQSQIEVAYGPDSRTVAALRDACLDAEAVYDALQRIRMENDARPLRGDEFAEQQVEKYFRSDRQKIEDGCRRFEARQASFTRAVREADD